MSELKPKKSAHEIAVEFAERFQKNYPQKPLFPMLDDLRKAIEEYGNTRADSSPDELTDISEGEEK